MTKHAFTGETYFDLHFRALGVGFKRIVRAVYAYTPEWAYYDQRRRKEVQGDNHLDLVLHVLAHRPSRRGIEGIPPTDQVWVPINSFLVRGLLKPGIYMELRKRIDEMARAEDRRRREDAGLPPASTPETI